MLDDFFMRALIGAVGLAAAAAPLGCVVVWQRMAYFGETLAHSSLLGIALAFAFNISMTLAVFLVSLLIALMLLFLQRRPFLSGDASLGILSHASLAFGLVVLSFLPQVRQDLSTYLFGDILSVSRSDVALIWLGGALTLIALARLWRPLIAATISDELAQAEGLHPQPARMAFMLLLALIIAIAMKIIGILLIGALLILPAAGARHLAATPEKMALAAVFLAVGAAISGLYASYYVDTPSGPSIVVMAFMLFLLTLTPFSRFFAAVKKRERK
ncbi:MAG: hypothetical protein DU429_03310 [Candidatus Tokpelaia sp.]|nr:MAG: hypothetical protein DU430_01170 [Candidatus Tokpelaia sp.]KAA6207144.1 MAG: hypothetical protein DU429_03310 [Candidatus Tokpelaia sp.]